MYRAHTSLHFLMNSAWRRWFQAAMVSGKQPRAASPSRCSGAPDVTIRVFGYSFRMAPNHPETSL